MSLVIAIHPDEVALGAALIVAAAGAVRRPEGGLVAAWDIYHMAHISGSSTAEQAIATMLEVAAATLSCPCACFRFGLTLLPRSPGLVPSSVPSFRREQGLLFNPALTALAADIDAGAFGLVISNGLRVTYTPNAEASFVPGILRLLPCRALEPLDSPEDVFAAAGFPTLIVSAATTPHTRSAHEVLDLCAQWAARLTADRPTAA